MECDDSSVRQMTFEPLDHFNPVLSPAGNQIVFYRTHTGDESQIGIIHANGSEYTIITDGSNFGTFPSWTPEGEYISFITGQ